jgi:hypothetical protein
MFKEILLIEKPNYENLRLFFIIEQQLIWLLPVIIVSYVMQIVAIISTR